MSDSPNNKIPLKKLADEQKSQEKMIISKSTRQKYIGIYDGFIYYFHYEYENLKRWRCKQRKCRGCVFTDSELTIIRKKNMTFMLKMKRKYKKLLQ
jgi:hypothetical protein